MTEIDVPDWVVEVAAMAVERSHHPEWSEEQFDAWWNHDPFFCERRTTWNGYENMTRKEKALATARHALTSALGAWVVPAGYRALGKPCSEGTQYIAYTHNPDTAEVYGRGGLTVDAIFTLRQEKPDEL